MKWILLASLVFSSITAFAEVAPGHIEGMLDQMVKDNVISKDEALKAKIRMKSMSPEQWSAVNKQATTIAARSPASSVRSDNMIEEVKGVDLDGAQFKQIQDEMKKIVPEYKD